MTGKGWVEVVKKYWPFDDKRDQPTQSFLQVMEQEFDKAIAEEREACAAIAECYIGPMDHVCLNIARDIRARGKIT